MTDSQPDVFVSFLVCHSIEEHADAETFTLNGAGQPRIHVLAGGEPRLARRVLSVVTFMRPRAAERTWQLILRGEDGLDVDSTPLRSLSIPAELGTLEIDDTIDFRNVPLGALLVAQVDRIDCAVQRIEIDFVGVPTS